MKSRATWIPWGVLLTSLALTGLATWGFGRAVLDRDMARFRSAVHTTQDRVEGRLQTYISVLVATRAFMLASPAMTERTFHHFIAHLELQRRYPGIQGIGLSLRIPPAELARVEADIARDRGAPFHVWPDERRDEYHAIVYLEPQDRRNEAAIGFDMFSEPVRREAMSRARDTGSAAASGKVTLVQEIDPRKQAGFLIYLPIYVDGDPGALEARRSTLRGFVYSPFRVGDLFEGIFGSEAAPGVTFDVYDGAAADAHGLMAQVGERTASHAAGRLRAAGRLEFAGHAWTLVFRSTPAFEAVSSRHFVPLFAIVGAAASAAIFLVTRAQVSARTEAETLAEENRRAVRVRDDFLSIAGHELRTPLSALKLQIQGLRRQATRGAFGPPSPKLVERLEKSDGHVDRLERLIGELLDVSRITSGRLTLHPEDVELTALLSEVAERFSDQLERAGSSLAIHADGRVVGCWDRVRIDQVLTNLVANAIKYGAGRPIDVTVISENGSAHVTVKDNGIGIAPEDRDRIFGRFERAVSGRHYGGLGLGLWIVRQIVAAHGGQITLASTPGAGSAFTVELPLALSKERPA